MRVVLTLTLFITLLIANRGLSLKEMAKESKVALVIGNSNYSGNFSKLKNPINDANDVAKALKERGFKVTQLENLNQYEFDEALINFSKELKRSKIGLFYFTGHGLEVDKRNYLVPVDTTLRDKHKVKYKAIAVDEIVDRMRDSNTRLNIVILDACRNNPFDKSGGGGLAPMSNAKGTLIAFATESGGVANENPSERNGLYTKYFLKALESKELNQREFFYNVRKRVYEESGENQLPYLNDGTIGEFYFNLPNISEVKFEDIKPKLYSLRVDTTPSNAKVKLLNINQNYYDGVELKEGSYKLEVSKDGYLTKMAYIDLKSDLSLNVELEREERVYSDKIWKDPATNLIWQNEPFSKEDKNNYDNWKEGERVLKWENAKRYCANLELAGYSDWRLPTRDELNTLLTKFSNKTSDNKSIYIKKEMLKGVTLENGNYAGSTFWSQTENSSNVWLVDFSVGSDGLLLKTNKFYVLCVR